MVSPNHPSYSQKCNACPARALHRPSSMASTWADGWGAVSRGGLAALGAWAGCTGCAWTPRAPHSFPRAPLLRVPMEPGHLLFSCIVITSAAYEVVSLAVFMSPLQFSPS